MKGTQTLMHRSDRVAECKFDARGYIQDISKVYNDKLLPICIKDNPVLDLQRWLLARGLAANRKDIAPLREFYGNSSFISTTGISLFDTYWFANKEYRDWDEVNAYDNWDCKKDSLFLMLVNPPALGPIDLNSPNLSVPGPTQRFWYRAGDKIYMLYGNAQEEVANYKRAGIENKYVQERNYAILAGNIYAKMESCTSKDVEMISLEDFYNSTKQPDKSNMENLKYCCDFFGMPNWKTFLAKMCEYDEAIENENRDLADVGVLRDTKTLEIIGFAPL